MVATAGYTRVIVHQFDPESPVPGGVDTCLRDMLLHAPATERILVMGVSQNRPVGLKVSLSGYLAQVDFIPVSRADPGNQRRWVPHSVRVAIGAIRYLKRRDARHAVLQFHRIEFGLIARLVPARRRVYFIHTNTTLSLQSNSDSFWRRIPSLYRAIERIVLKNVDLTVVFNAETGNYLNQCGYNITVLRTWFNDRVYRPAFDSEKTDKLPRSSVNLLWVGRLEAPKDPLLALDVMAELTKRESPATTYSLTYLGDGTLRETLEMKTERYGISSKVELRGAVSQETVALCMRHADCLLMTSHFEGSPRVMYEALGSGLPVVASSDADPDKTLVPTVNGQSVESRDPADFAAAIRSIAGLSADTIARSVSSQAASGAVEHLWKVTNG